MGFEEFLLARGQKGLKDFLTTFNSGLKPPIPSVIHQKLLNLLKEYMMVGGMPGAVKAYIESNLDISKAWQEHSSILQTFFLDFGKYKKRANIGLLQDLFIKIPSQLGRTIKYSALNREAKSREIKECLDLLQKARLIYPIMHSHGNGLPLGAETEPSSFKILFLDIGLALSLLGINVGDLVHAESLTKVNSGALAEQFIGQHLLYAQPEYSEPRLYYWNRPAKGSTAEVDFLVQKENRVLPIEVKAGATGRLRSLHMFVQEKNCDLAYRFNIDPHSILHTYTAIAGKPSRPFTLVSLPLYLVESVFGGGRDNKIGTTG
jgi:predicted AAA+ superfamily ATPase